MSDHYIILVPDDPRFVPAVDGQQRAVDRFRALAPDAGVSVHTSEAIEFVDCGGNFERIVCPMCDRELELGWWTQRMDEEYASGYPLRPLELPCGCHQALNQLIYEWPQAFGRFRLEAMNPNLGELPEETLEEFKNLLGCRLIVVYRHI